MKQANTNDNMIGSCFIRKTRYYIIKLGENSGKDKLWNFLFNLSY
jgi:hypothetical protein